MIVCVRMHSYPLVQSLNTCSSQDGPDQSLELGIQSHKSDSFQLLHHHVLPSRVRSWRLELNPGTQSRLGYGTINTQHKSQLHRASLIHDIFKLYKTVSKRHVSGQKSMHLYITLHDGLNFLNNKHIFFPNKK